MTIFDKLTLRVEQLKKSVSINKNLILNSMEKSFKLLPPMMPNFLPYETKPGKKQDGFKPDTNRISVQDLSESEAIEYGELMKQAFIEHWRFKVALEKKFEEGRREEQETNIWKQ